MSKKTQQSQSQKTPKLRFPGFSGGWSEERMGSIFNIQAGGDIETANASKVKTEKFKYPIYANSDKNKGLYGYSDIYRVDEGCITVSGRGNIGVANARSEKFYPIVRLLVLKPKEEASVNFFEYCINQINFFVESTGVPQLTGPQISTYKIIFPPYLEQKKIAGFLGAVDEWVQNLRAQKKSFESYKKGLMQKIFSQEIRFKDKNGKGFPKWEEKKLGEVAEIVGGGTPDTTKDQYWNGEINWFTPTEIKQKYSKGSLRKISKAGLANSSAKLLPIGTILFTSRATVGDVSISTEECATNQGFQSFVANDKASNMFLYYWVLQNKNQFLRRANGSTFLEISGTEMKKMKSIFPTFPEQQKIAEFLTSVDNIIQSKQQQITQAEQWKKGLMQGLFV